MREAPEAPVGFAALIAWSRDTSTDEPSVLNDFVTEQQARHVARDEQMEAARRKALADLCHMLLAANEFVYVD